MQMNFKYKIKYNMIADTVSLNDEDKHQDINKGIICEINEL